MDPKRKMSVKDEMKEPLERTKARHHILEPSGHALEINPSHFDENFPLFFELVSTTDPATPQPRNQSLPLSLSSYSFPSRLHELTLALGWLYWDRVVNGLVTVVNILKLNYSYFYTSPI